MASAILMIKVLFLRWWLDCFEVCDAAAASGLADYPRFIGCLTGCLDPRIFAPHRSHLVSPGGYDERSLAFDRLAHGARLRPHSKSGRSDWRC